MSVLEMVGPDDPVLRRKSEVFEFVDQLLAPALAKDVADTMLSLNGLGLSACQVGIPRRVFAIRTNPVLVCFNPRVVDQDDVQIVLDEGCLSFPGLVVKVKRPRACRLRFQLPNGETETRKFDGLTARTVLHEMDHLDGVLFFDRATRYHRDQAMRRWKQWKRRNKVEQRLVPGHAEDAHEVRVPGEGPAAQPGGAPEAAGVQGQLPTGGAERIEVIDVR